MVTESTSKSQPVSGCISMMLGCFAGAGHAVLPGPGMRFCMWRSTLFCMLRQAMLPEPQARQLQCCCQPVLAVPSLVSG